MQPAGAVKERAPAISVIIPAKDEEAGIGRVIARVREVMEPLGRTYEVIVVDDGSADSTAEEALKAGAVVIRHPYNIGNGAAVKTGIRGARGKIMVMLDADGQHPPEDIPRLLEKLDSHHMAVGARAQGSDTSFHRSIANTIYNWFASYVCGRKIEDLTSGFRAVRGAIAREFVSLLPNTFSYPTTITLATVRSGYSLVYVPVKAARREANSRSKIRLFRDGSRFFLIIFKISTLFSPLKIFLPASLLTFMAGFCYGFYRVLAWHIGYGPTSAMLMTFALLIFLIGLVSEQITHMRFDRINPFAGEQSRRAADHRAQPQPATAETGDRAAPAAGTGRAVR